MNQAWYSDFQSKNPPPKSSSSSYCDIVPSAFPLQLSSRLNEKYGEREFLAEFDKNVREDEELLEKYKQMMKFMQTDQETRLPGSPRSRRTRSFIKEVLLYFLLEEELHIN